MAKYKLIREYPGSPELGYISNGNIYMSGTNEYDCKDYPEFWEKVEAFLFKTLDGVDIFEGDKYWLAYSSNWNIYQVSREDVGVDEKHRHGFSTEKLAKEYVYKNIPRYSENDIKSFVALLNRNQEWNEVYLFNLWKAYLKDNNNE